MWFLKITIKIIFSRLKIPYKIWKKLNIFKHGQMESFEYSRKIFEGHFNDMNKFVQIKNPIIMELGPEIAYLAWFIQENILRKNFILLMLIILLLRILSFTISCKKN